MMRPFTFLNKTCTTLGSERSKGGSPCQVLSSGLGVCWMATRGLQVGLNVTPVLAERWKQLRTCCLRIVLVQSVDWEEELLPPPLSLLGEGDGTVEEERTGQSSRFNGPGMGGKFGLAMGMELGAAVEAPGLDGKLGLVLGRELKAWLEASERDGKLGLALGIELGAGLEASWMDGKLGMALGRELGAGLEASGMDVKLGLALGRELGAGLEASGMDGKLGLAMGKELGAAVEASWMDGKLGLGLGTKLRAGRDEGWEWKILGRQWCISINLFLNRRD